jgi:hypothetical protein
MITNTFPRLEAAILQAEFWTNFIKTNQATLASSRWEKLESIVWIGVLEGETLPYTWRLTFDTLLLPGKELWTTVKEFEAVRQKVRRLFFTSREAMDFTRQVGELLQALTGQKPAAMDRLLAAIENARKLEKDVFRNWDSFTETLPPSQPGASLSVDESLAKALGITVEEARLRMEARRRELTAERG